MNNLSSQHLFWGNSSPLAAFGYGGLLIMATVRFSFALITCASMFWVYCLSVLIFRSAPKIFPVRALILCQTFLTSFLTGLFLLALWLLCPLAAFESFFIISLIPAFCISSGIFQRVESLDASEAVTRALGESAVASALILIFALIREPIGLLTLSVPGGYQGIIFLFSSAHETFLPVHIIAASSGAFILLGYAAGLYRYYRNINAPREKSQ